MDRVSAAKASALPPDRLLKEMFDKAVQCAQPINNILEFLPSLPQGRTVVIGAGKATGAMAKAFETYWTDDFDGLVVTRYGYSVPCDKFEVIEAAHPVPDLASLDASKRILSKVENLTSEDLVICLISGGGSSLLSLPVDGVSFDDYQEVNRVLLKSGATIKEMNVIRKHLCKIKGGQLAAAAYPAKVVSLLISDVPGDDISSIASGPTVIDESTFADALAIVERYAMDLPSSVLSYFKKAENETPKAGDVRLKNTVNHVIATPQKSLEAAADIGKKHGFNTMILSDSIEGESADVAKVHVSIVHQVLRFNQPIKPPCIILSGGETTVTVKGNGRGGRNVEFALALAIGLDERDNVYAIACDTDGIDGTEDNAGAFVHPGTLKQALQNGLSALDYLDNNDGYTFFDAIDGLIKTGPTNTNVNDFRAILIK